MTSTPQDAAPHDDVLDLDAWIDGITLPEETVTVYADTIRASRHAALEEQLAEAIALENAAASAGVPDEERGLGDEPPSSALARQIDENYLAMKASGRTFRVRGLSAAENDALIDAHRTPAGSIEEGYLFACLSAQIVEPPVTPEQAKRLRERLAAGEFLKIYNAARRLNSQQVDLPLS